MSRTRPDTEEPAHDVLAAEAFAVPAPDPVLHHEPLHVPEDPSGIAEPHDVLAAEEFAMPTAEARRAGGGLAPHADPRWRAGAVALAGFALARLLRRRRG